MLIVGGINLIPYLIGGGFGIVISFLCCGCCKCCGCGLFPMRIEG